MLPVGHVKKERQRSSMQITVCLRQGHLELFHSAVAFGETVFSLGVLSDVVLKRLDAWGPKSLSRSKDKREHWFFPLR